MRDFVWTCDYCEKKVSGVEIPRGFYQVECKVKTREKSHSFDIAMCSDCWDNTVDPSPKGLWKRLIKKFRPTD